MINGIQFESFKKYDEFTVAWLIECKRILKKNGCKMGNWKLPQYF